MNKFSRKFCEMNIYYVPKLNLSLDLTAKKNINIIYYAHILFFKLQSITIIVLIWRRNFIFSYQVHKYTRIRSQWNNLNFPTEQRCFHACRICSMEMCCYDLEVNRNDIKTNHFLLLTCSFDMHLVMTTGPASCCRLNNALVLKLV